MSSSLSSLVSSMQRFAEIQASTLTLREAWLLDVTCALLVHLIYNRYEPQPIHVFRTIFLLLIAPLLPSYFLVPQLKSHQTPFAILCALFVVYLVFYTTLFTSIAIYRISPFHPLAKFPGPRMGRISNAWAAAVASTGKRYEYFKKLHDLYGPYVRVGPNELSCTDVSAITHLLGTDGLPKGPMWTATRLPGRPLALVGVSDFDERHRRRKAWNRAFSTAAVKGYEGILEFRLNQLVEQLESHNSRVGEMEESLDLASWFNRFSFDFMGDMVFNGGFSMMVEGDKTGIKHMMESGLKVVAVITYYPYLVSLLWKIPMATKAFEKLLLFSEKHVEERLERGSRSKDIIHYLTNEDKPDEPPAPFEQIISDASLAVVAGYDTVSTTLAFVFFNLLANPDTYSRLRTEVDEHFPPGELEHVIIDSAKLADMPYLNAVINESLRLQPAVPVTIQRQTMEEPKWTGSCYLPPGTAININPYAIHRDPRYFSPLPDTFWPDRWLLPHQRRQPTPPTSDPNYSSWSRKGGKVDIKNVTTNTAAFMPFSSGPAICAGKNLAILEMRSVVCYLVRKFDMRFGMDGKIPYRLERWEADRSDYFTFQVGKLPVVLQCR